MLVSAAWLAEHVRDPGLVVADVRWSPTEGTSGAHRAFEHGHIPGAVFLDVDRDLGATPFVDGPGRHPLPTPEVFSRTLSAAGIGDGAFVIASDDVRGSVAARLWWMLDATGRRAALLDGGLEAWSGPLESGPAQRRPPADAEVRPWPAGRVVGADEVAAAIRDRTAVVLDARAAERYRGEVEPIDPVSGHIPGARSAPWIDDLDEEGRFLRRGSAGTVRGARPQRCRSGDHALRQRRHVVPRRVRDEAGRPRRRAPVCGLVV